MRDVGIDIGMDVGMNVETVMEQLLLYYAVPIAAKGKLSLGHRRTEVVRDRYGRRDWKDSGRADWLEIVIANKRKERLEFKVRDGEGDKTARDCGWNGGRRIYISLFILGGAQNGTPSG